LKSLNTYRIFHVAVTLAATGALLLGQAANASAITTIYTADFSLDSGSNYNHSSGDWQIEAVAKITDMTDLQQPDGVGENQTFLFRSLTFPDGHWKITEATLVPYTGSSSGEANFNNNWSSMESYDGGGTNRHTILATRNDSWDSDASSQFTAVNELATGEVLVGVIYDLNHYNILNHDFGITSFTIEHTIVPEPATLSLLVAGVLWIYRRQRPARAAAATWSVPRARRNAPANHTR